MKKIGLILFSFLFIIGCSNHDKKETDSKDSLKVKSRLDSISNYNKTIRNHKDSIIINEMNVVKLTDTINSKLPSNIRTLTIQHLKSKGLNPEEYYIFNEKKGEYINIKIK